MPLSYGNTAYLWRHPLNYRQIEDALTWELSDMWNQIDECLTFGYFGRNHPAAMETSLWRIDEILNGYESSLYSDSFWDSDIFSDTDCSLIFSSEDEEALPPSRPHRSVRGRGGRRGSRASRPVPSGRGNEDEDEVDESGVVDAALIAATTGIGEDQEAGQEQGTRRNAGRTPGRGRGRGRGGRRGP